MNKATSKYYLMASGILLILVLEWMYGRQTFTLVSQFGRNANKLEMAKHASLRVPELRKQIEEINIQLSHMNAGSQPEAPSSDFLSYLSGACKEQNIHLNQLPESEAKKEGKLDFLETAFEVEGSFSDILRLLYRLEEEDHSGIISSLNMEFKEIRTQNGKRDLLFAHLQLKRFTGQK